MSASQIINDQFTHLPVSRQRKYQLRRKAEGKCVICGQPAVMEMRCLAHAIYNREKVRKAIGATRRYNSKSYRLERALTAEAGR